MCSDCADQLGSVDILINNAGIQFVSPVDEFPEDKWNDIMDIIMNSAFHTTKAVLAGHEGEWLGPDHQYRFDAQQSRQSL